MLPVYLADGVFCLVLHGGGVVGGGGGLVPG